MNATHTPGPWELRQEAATWFEVYHGSSRHPICHVYKRVDKRDAPLAEDARLIATAPELLDALRAVVKPLERLGDFIGNADAGGASGLGPFDRGEILLAVRNAIAKAEGRDET